MNTQMKLQTAVIQKQAWIDAANRIVSFRKIAEAAIYSATEEDFWTYIMALVNVGYRLQ